MAIGWTRTIALAIPLVLAGLLVSGCDFLSGDSGESGSCSEQKMQELVDRAVELYGDGNPDIPTLCGEIIPNGTFTASIDMNPLYDQPTSIQVTVAGTSLVSVEGVPCTSVFPGKLKNDFDLEDCAQLFQCGCCILKFEKASTKEWLVEGVAPGCDEGWDGRAYLFKASTGQVTEPSCSDQGGLTTPSGACLLPCSSNSDCSDGDSCRWGMYCMDYCYGPGECDDGLECNFHTTIGSCDIPCSPSCPPGWECYEDAVHDGEFKCIPPDLWGINSAACKSCLDSCKGLMSCCTGCGCICESQCGTCMD